MNPVRLIEKKRNGGRLEPDELAELIDGYVRGRIPDYQMAALAMAIFFRGMDPDETADLTEQMLCSGAVLRRPARGPPRVDKHSTGGVGDKTSLVLAPLLAACGLKVPMLSGRGLGATGGTLDKLEAIPGFRTDLGADEIEAIVDRVGCVITGQTEDLVPADRKLYALRDVTATVPSIPLITASILSKKLAESLDCLVLDVKWGSGAFMKELADARQLARSLCDVAARLGLKARAVVTDMNQPLGRMAGAAVEVQEAVAALQGQGPPDLAELVLALGSELLLLAGSAATAHDARRVLQAELDSGRALEKFHQMVAAQRGALAAPLPIAPPRVVSARRSGFVCHIDTQRLGHAVIALGGGRQRLGEAIDPSVGLEMLVRRGQPVAAGEPLMRLFSTGRGEDEAGRLVEAAITLGDEPPAPLPLIADTLG